MLINMWNYMRGYVIIEVTGFSVERFVNLAAHRGVYIWNVNYTGSCVRMNVTVKGFKELKVCARKTGCKFKIIEKKGYPFKANRFRKRKFFALGIVLFVFFMYFMSTFIWLVEVNGVNRVDIQRLIDFCEDNGLYAGARKNKINRRNLEKAITLNFPDISFINIGITGTKAEISIAETIPKQNIIDKSVPCDIIAAKDGIISQISVMSGTPKVREKDVVLKGDILVSGELSAGTEYETTVVGYTHSSAEVRAKLYYDMNFTVDENYAEKIYSGKSKTSYAVKILNKDLKLFNYSNLYANYDKIIERNQIKFGEAYPLPVIIIKETYKEYEPAVKKRSLEEMKEVAQIMVNNRIIREFDFSADVVEKMIEYSEAEEGLSVKAVIVTNEDIGETREIEEFRMKNEE